MEPEQQESGTPTTAPARVGVVVPVFDGETFLRATLDSVLAQTYPGWQCVVVDDGSLDASGEIADSYAAADPRFTVVHQVNAGSPTARNRALRELAPSVELVALLDADDTWLDDALGRLVAALDGDPAAVGAYGTAEYMDADGAPLHPGRHPEEQRDRRVVRGLDLARVPADEVVTSFASLVVTGPVWPPAVALLRRDVVEAVAGFDEDLRQCEDWDLFLRSSRHGHLHFLDRTVARYRRHGGNVSADYVENVRYQDVVRRKARSSPDNSRAQRWVVERAWRALEHRLLARAVLTAVRSLPRDRARSRTASAAALRHLVRLASPPRRTPPVPAPIADEEAGAPGRERVVPTSR